MVLYLANDDSNGARHEAGDEVNNHVPEAADIDLLLLILAFCGRSPLRRVPSTVVLGNRSFHLHSHCASFRAYMCLSANCRAAEESLKSDCDDEYEYANSKLSLVVVLPSLLSRHGWPVTD